MERQYSSPRNPLISAASPTEDAEIAELVRRERMRAKANRHEARRERRKERIEMIKKLTEMAKESDVWEAKKHWKFSNPGPISLLGYGMTIILMGLGSTGHWEHYSVALGMSVVFGGGIQIVGGILEYVCGNTLAWTVFVLNGAYWLSIVGILMFTTAESGGSPIVVRPTEYFLGVYFLLWTIVSASFVASSFMTNIVSFGILFSQFLAYLFLAIGFMAHTTRFYHAAAYTGLVSGGLSLYLAYAEIINEVFDQMCLPVIHFKDLPWFKDQSCYREQQLVAAVNKQNRDNSIKSSISLSSDK